MIRCAVLLGSVLHAEQGGQPWSPITSQTDGTPNGGFAQAVRDHLASL